MTRKSRYYDTEAKSPCDHDRDRDRDRDRGRDLYREYDRLYVDLLKSSKSGD